ncbi:hypothetical protein [Halomonas halocynthiae]|uniref:hypothetical protein n=1 Tax=Halomonas halocynthiae TaxID=176290 RepID=UPI0004083602|nr:hypothetical protein [Halomonas halocynthiae]
MSVISQLNEKKARGFARHCFEKITEEKLRDMAMGPASEHDMKHWGLSEGEWEEAVSAALADMQSEKTPPSD